MQLGIWGLRCCEFESARWAIGDLSLVLWTRVAGYRSNLGDARLDLEFLTLHSSIDSLESELEYVPDLPISKTVTQLPSPLVLLFPSHPLVETALGALAWQTDLHEFTSAFP